ncbi:hypothetical protein GCM10027167_60170 [Nocardia heshunensis]
MGDDPNPVLTAQLRTELVQPLPAASSQMQMAPLRRERPRNLRADPRRRPRHDRGPAAESQFHWPIS